MIFRPLATTFSCTKAAHSAQIESALNARPTSVAQDNLENILEQSSQHVASAEPSRGRPCPWRHHNSPAHPITRRHIPSICHFKAPHGSNCRQSVLQSSHPGPLAALSSSNTKSRHMISQNTLSPHVQHDLTGILSCLSGDHAQETRSWPFLRPCWFLNNRTYAPRTVPTRPYLASF